MSVHIDPEEYSSTLTREQMHVPSPLYPASWQPTELSQVWQSAPTTFRRAVHAWEAAASSQASPYQPPHILCLALHCYPYEDPNAEQLLELCIEADRRANWLPNKQIQAPACFQTKVWKHKGQYGLLWESSVQTILAYTAAGWVVRIIGEHRSRQDAAERALVFSE